MLILSRKLGDRITIGDDVQITITRIAGGRVSIGIDAPKEVAVRRHELVARKPAHENTRSEVEPLAGSHHELQIPA